ncbi:hypothetical protein PG993_010761 [Apiospora rasikravindrae]|uniref:Uncharacterized protein n=1 Tax=Apiospora rasikravindrae TaxID=990691 RepID=A0ABR1SCC8_9PEZI
MNLLPGMGENTPSILLWTCTYYYPVLEKILDNLSATESSILLAVIGLGHGTGTTTNFKRYLSIYRDMPELHDWWHLMASKGHSIWLAGSGLATLESRVRDPLQYWNKGYGRDVIRLWLLVKASGADQEMARRKKIDPLAQYALTESGDIIWSHTPEMEKLKSSGKFVYGNIIPIPGTFPRRDDIDDSWRKSDVPNENRIEFVCSLGWRERIGLTSTPIPTYEICAMVQGQCHLGERYCDRLGPGAVHLPTGLKQVDVYIVPYIQIAYEPGTERLVIPGKAEMSQYTQDLRAGARDDDVAIGIREKNMAILIQLGCCNQDFDSSWSSQVVRYF